jgi:hypothetical protein
LKSRHTNFNLDEYTLTIVGNWEKQSVLWHNMELLNESNGLITQNFLSDNSRQDNHIDTACLMKPCKENIRNEPWKVTEIPADKD